MKAILHRAVTPPAIPAASAAAVTANAARLLLARLGDGSDPPVVVG